jgi:BirA family biotin operon repressor/biotin-[acetyl-CoA-carboxylase] ligase
MSSSIDLEILKALRSSGDAAVSGADLSQQLGVSRAAIWARMRELRALGYEIEASPHRGYRLLATPDLLHADDLVARLGPTRVIGRDIRVFRQTTSTNDVVEKMARDGVKEGVVVFAETQTCGRGRLGRKWTSPPGKGLWFSILLRPDMRPLEMTRITVASATALRRAIAGHSGLTTDIKWPNDILINGRKVAGILTELSAELDHVNFVILGIGVDVNVAASDLAPDVRRTATSLKIEAGRSIPRPDLAVAILRELDHDYNRIGIGQFAAVSDEWQEHCVTLGRHVSIRMGPHEFRGRAEALGENGELLLRSEHGHLERISGGDVSLDK